MKPTEWLAVILLALSCGLVVLALRVIWPDSGN
jgi:hypothetical protein